LRPPDPACIIFPALGSQGALHFSRPKGAEMPLVHIVLVLIVVGVLLWLINSFIPMDAKIKSILNIVVVIAVVIWLLQAFGLMGSLSSFRVGR
jgi:hypothetical protein